MKNLVTCEDRLKSMAIIDKTETTPKINKVLKAEVLYLLNNYLDITAENLDVDLGVDNNGEYVLSIFAKARHLKVARIIER